jgi:hypothetical protein
MLNRVALRVYTEIRLGAGDAEHSKTHWNLLLSQARPPRFGGAKVKPEKVALLTLSGIAAAVAVRELSQGRTKVRWPRRRHSDAWTFDNRFPVLPVGRKLRIELTNPAVVHWTVDQWDTAHDTRTAPENGVHVADLPTASLKNGTHIQFTFFWPDVNRWEGEDFELLVQEGAARYAT